MIVAISMVVEMRSTTEHINSDLSGKRLLLFTHHRVRRSDKALRKDITVIIDYDKSGEY